MITEVKTMANFEISFILHRGLNKQSNLLPNFIGSDSIDGAKQVRSRHKDCQLIQSYDY